MTDAFIQQCCRIATIRRRKLRSAADLTARPEDLDVEVADFLAKRIAVEAKQIGGPDLVAPGCRESGGEQRILDFTQDAVVEAGRRQSVLEAGKISRQMALHRSRKAVIAGMGLLAAGRHDGL